LKLARCPRPLAATSRGFTFYLESPDSRFAASKADAHTYPKAQIKSGGKVALLCQRDQDGVFHLCSFS
jgi:hypothetical protein